MNERYFVLVWNDFVGSHAITIICPRQGLRRIMDVNSNNHEAKARAADNDADDLYGEQPYTAPQVKNNKRRKPELSDNHEAKGRAADKSEAKARAVDKNADDLHGEQPYTAPQVRNNKRRKPELPDNHEAKGRAADKSEAKGRAADKNADDASEVKNPKRRKKLELVLRHVHDMQSMTNYHEGLLPEPAHSYIFMCEDDIVDEPQKGLRLGNQREGGPNYTFMAPEAYSSNMKLGSMLVSIGKKMCEDAALNLECGTNWKITNDVYGFFSGIHGPNKKLPGPNKKIHKKIPPL